MEQEEYNNLPDSQKWSAAKRDMIAGALWCIGGLAVTFLSYYFAKNGSKYILAYGAVLFGAFQGIRGLVNYLKLTRRYDEPEKFRKGLVLGILAIVAVVGLSVWGYNRTHAGNVKFLSYEQVIQDDVAGVTFTIPSEFSEVEKEEIPETDSSCVMAYYYTIGPDKGISVETTRNLFALLAAKYILSDTTNYDQKDTAEMSRAIEDIFSYKEYFNLLDSTNMEELFYDSYGYVIGERTYLKSAGYLGDGVSAVIFRTKNDYSMVEIRVLYDSDQIETNREMENWASDFIKTHFKYSAPAPEQSVVINWEN